MVSARLRGDALPASTGSDGSAVRPARAGQRRRGWSSLLLWSQLLLLTTVARDLGRAPAPGPRAVDRRRRRCCWPMLWQVFENLALLLPNTL